LQKDDSKADRSRGRSCHPIKMFRLWLLDRALVKDDASRGFSFILSRRFDVAAYRARLVSPYHQG